MKHKCTITLYVYNDVCLRECRDSRGRFVMLGGRLGERLTMVVAVCVPPGLPSSQTTVSWYEGVVSI